MKGADLLDRIIMAAALAALSVVVVGGAYGLTYIDTAPVQVNAESWRFRVLAPTPDPNLPAFINVQYAWTGQVTQVQVDLDGTGAGIDLSVPIASSIAQTLYTATGPTTAWTTADLTDGVFSGVVTTYEPAPLKSVMLNITSYPFTPTPTITPPPPLPTSTPGATATPTPTLPTLTPTFTATRVPTWTP